VAEYRYKAFISYSHAADGELAPALQSALHRFAKPWNRLRAMRVFRDKTGLGVTPGLWRSIEQALAESEYFLLLASPQAAQSKWVEQEVDWWLRNRSPRRLLIVQTDDELRWDNDRADFDWSITNALPLRLAKVFQEEPHYLDLRWARRASDLSVRKPEFLEAIARLTATLRNQPVDELIGEDVAQHRKTRLLARVAVATLGLLLAATAVAAILAVQQRDRAEAQSREAQRQRASAEEQTRIAEAQTEQSRRRLVRLYVANGLRQMEQNDLSASLLWFAEALQLERGFPQGERTQRVRLGAVLRQHPQLRQLWPCPQARSAEFSTDGRYVEVETEEGNVLVWDAATGKPVPSLSRPGSQAGLIRNGQEVLKIHPDNRVEVWSGEGTGSVTLQHSEPVIVADLSSDGTRVLTLDSDRRVRLFDAASGRYLTSLGDWAGVDYASFSPDGKTVVQVSRRGWALIWDVAQDTQVTEVRHQGAVIHAAFSPDSRRFATAATDDTARVWDARTGAPLSPPLHHGDTVSHVAFHSDGTRLATVSSNRLIRIWDLGAAEPQTLRHDSAVRYAAFGGDGKRILTLTDFAAQLWSLETGRAIPLQMPESQLYFGGFSPDGRWVTTAAQDGAVRLWDAVTGRQLRSLPHDRKVNHVDISRDGRRLAAASHTELVVWDLEATRRIATLRHRSPVLAVQFDRDGKRLLSLEFEAKAHLWRVGETGEIAEISSFPEVDLAVLSADGARVATAAGLEVQIWNVANGRQSISRMAASNRLRRLAFSPDGGRLVTASQDGVARIWEVATGAAVTPPMRHDGGLMHIEFSPDGTQVLTAGEDRSARLWEAASGEPLTPPLRHRDLVRHATFRRDGERIVTSSGDQTARVWDISASDPHLLEALGQLLSARRIDDTGAVVALGQPALLAAWQQWRATSR